MTHYLLSAHTVDGAERTPMPPDAFARLSGLEHEMRSTGTWVFSGKLHDPDTATVVRIDGGRVVTTDGPFAEAKEHIGGFYVITAPDLDAALGWAAKVAEVIGKPIEVRPFAGFTTEPMG